MKRTALWALAAGVATAVVAACSGTVAGSAAACKGGECDSPDSGAHREAGAPPSEAAVVPGPHDGSRLTGEGIDLRHGTRCAAHPTTDGKVRCFPDTPYSSIIEGVFADPTCTALLAIAPGPQTCDLTERLFVNGVADNGSCPNPEGEARAFRFMRDNPFGETYRRSSSGACERFAEPPTDLVFNRAAVTPTEPDEWVDLVRSETPVTTGLAVSYWEGSDGSRFFDSYRLGPNGERCEPFPPPEAGRTSYCVPKRALVSSSAYTFDSCSPLPETLLTCDGGMVQISAYPELEVTLSGTGRLRMAYLTAEGQKLRAIGYHDTELNGPCYREVLEDGVAYCVGAGKFSSLQSGLFTDPACSREVAAFRRDCSGQEPSAVLTGSGATCSDTPLFLEHTEHAGPIYGFTFADPVGCAEYPREEGVAYYAPGAPLPPGKLFAPYPDPL